MKSSRNKNQPQRSRFSIRRCASFVFLFGSVAIPAFAQERASAAQSVHSLVRQCAPTQPKTHVLSRSLVPAEGKLAKFDADSLYLKKKKRYVRILNSNILELHCGGKFVSNVPAATTRPHGEWNDINQIYPNTRILVVLTDGSAVKGYSNSATDSEVIMFDPKTEARRDIPREKVSALFGLLGGGGGIKSGASKGSEGLLQPGGDPILGGVGAAIGAIIGAITKSDGRPILVYSR